MVERVRRGRILQVTVDISSPVPLYRQIYQSIRRDILNAVLAPGAQLPSTRHLAADIRVARSTVVQAYDQLRAEGYVAGTLGAGTRVSKMLPDQFVRPSVISQSPTASVAIAPRISARGQAILGIPRRTELVMGNSARAFRAAVPALDIFPIDIWGRLLARRWSRTTSRMLSYNDPLGYVPLRAAIAEYLRAARGVRCLTEQVLVVSGSQQAIDLCARVLLDPGDKAWIEDPGYFGARGAFTAAGAHVIPVPVDDEGLSVNVGRRLAPDARVAFVTPSRQLPLGVTMSLPRRLALLDWAAEAGAWVLEDDYDSEFRYASRPLAALQGLDTRGCVLYVGTFSKVLFPALRLGYLVVPESLIDAFTAARHFADYNSPYLSQAVLADFITDGHFERHIRRMRLIYCERQRVLVEAAREHLAGRVTIAPADGGMTLIARLRADDDDVQVARAAERAGIDTLALGPFAVSVPLPPALLLGYSGVRDVELREGVSRLASVLEKLDSGRTQQRSLHMGVA